MKVDLFSGGLAIAAGVACASAAASYRIGTARSMGPGYFPLVVGVLLVALGALLVVTSLREDGVRVRLPDPRGAAMVVAAPVVFAFTVGVVGLVVPLAAVTALGAFAVRGGSLRSNLLICAAVLAAALTVFAVGLGLPIPLFVNPLTA